jgi:uncharacterized RDD family membrane protein YckC
VLVAILLGPILIPVVVSIVLIVKLKNRLGVRSNQVTPRLMKFFFLWGGAIALAWVVFVIGTTAILNSAQGPLALFLLPWAFAGGAAIGVGHWYRKHYAT